MKPLFAHTVILVLIDLALFQHYIVLTMLYCSTAELLPPELHLRIRVATGKTHAYTYT